MSQKNTETLELTEDEEKVKCFPSIISLPGVYVKDFSEETYAHSLREAIRWCERKTAKSVFAYTPVGYFKQSAFGKSIILS